MKLDLVMNFEQLNDVKKLDSRPALTKPAYLSRTDKRTGKRTGKVAASKCRVWCLGAACGVPLNRLDWT